MGSAPWRSSARPARASRQSGAGRRGSWPRESMGCPSGRTATTGPPLPKRWGHHPWSTTDQPTPAELSLALRSVASNPSVNQRDGLYFSPGQRRVAPAVLLQGERQSLVRRDRDDRGGPSDPGIGNREQQHDDPERVFGLDISVGNPEPSSVVLHGNVGV